MIAVVAYGLGNIQAFVNIYRRLGISVDIAGTTDDLCRAEKVILPGVGAFDWAMSCLDRSGLRDCLDLLVLQEHRPVLGVCVGMQIMARSSQEGKLQGLSWIDAVVTKFGESSGTEKTRVPHMGWNEVVPQRSDSLFRGIGKDATFYFLHSYFVVPQSTNEVLGVTDYDGTVFASAVGDGNVFGVQFHPEKSHEFGIQLLRNFAEL